MTNITEGKLLGKRDEEGLTRGCQWPCIRGKTLNSFISVKNNFNNKHLNDGNKYTKRYRNQFIAVELFRKEIDLNYRREALPNCNH